MRLLITGAAGAGTTTLGRALAERWGGRFVDADDFFWLPSEPPYQVRRDQEERRALMRAALESPKVVVAGSVMGWGAEIEDAFDPVVFLYVDTAVRLQRLRSREIARFGQANEEFLAWASQYDTGPAEGRSLTKHRAWLAARTCPVIELSGDVPLASLVEQVGAQVT